MPLSIDTLLEHQTTLALVLVRVSMLVIVAPILGSMPVPHRARVGLALALAMVILPVEMARTSPGAWSNSGFLVAAGGEALVGLTLGLGVRIFFAAMQVSGQIISQMSGLQLAEVFSPTSNTSVPLFSQLLTLVTGAVFVLMGGHRSVIEALLDTFTTLPAGQAGFSRSGLDAMTLLLSQSFDLGLRAAAPAVVALLLATLILGLVSRTLPQLNLMSMGLSINALVALVALGASLGGACWILQDQLEPMLATAAAALNPR